MTKAAELAKWGEVSTNGQVSGRRNIVINGAMQVAQRATSATGKTTGGYFTVDRSKFDLVNLGTHTYSQSTDAPEGFSNSLRIDCTTTASLSADSLLYALCTGIEGQDVQQLKKGTSNAEAVTISFYVKSNKTGTYVLEVYDGTNTRHIGKTYTINSANTWEYKTLTFVGDTTGAIANSNAFGMGLFFWVSGGSNYTSGTLPSGWSSVTTANRAAGLNVNIADNTANDWAITGVQMEVGSVATPFEHRSFGEELALCQRYHYRAGKAESAYTNFGQGWATAARAGTIQIPLPVEMRAEPSVTINDVQVSDDVNSAIDCTAIAVNAATGGRQLAVLEFTVGSDVTQYRSYGLRGSNNTASHVSLSAEL
tara:strand:+ start:242 stop:1342 length:1101 start_codon:yes stop_codon:yes gene_type:complete